MSQEIMFGEINFKMNYMKKYELFDNKENYFPLIMSINYQDAGKNIAFICYCIFTKNSEGDVNGIRVIKQVVLINGIPFMIKSIYGLKPPE